MKKVILVLVVLSLTACLSRPKVETIVVGDSVAVKIDSVKVDSAKAVVDSVKVK